MSDFFILMDRKFSEDGVSPVVGVVLMISITFILGAVVLQFTLGLTDIFSSGPEASVSVQQNIDDFDPDGKSNYSVSVRLTETFGSDYVIVNVLSDNNVSVNADRLGSDPSNIEGVPNIEQTDLTDDPDTGTVITQRQDIAVVNGVTRGDTIQVYAVESGDRTLITEYIVKDTTP